MNYVKLVIFAELCLTQLLAIWGKNLGLSHAFSLTHNGKLAFRGGGGNSKDDVKLIPVEFIAETNLPTDIGHFRLRAYRITDESLIEEYQGKEPCVIYATHRPPFDDSAYLSKNVPIRLHDQCITSEVFRSQRCDCREQLRHSLEYIHEHGGAIIYLQQEGRGIGIANKVAAYALQDIGLDTVDANVHLGLPEDNRNYAMVPAILADLGVQSISLMTNNPRKVQKLQEFGVSVTDTIAVVSDNFVTEWNKKYIATKVDRMRHQNYKPLLAKSLTQTKKKNSSFANLMMPRAGATPITAANGATSYNDTDLSPNLNSLSTLVAENAVISALHLNDTTSSPISIPTIVTANPQKNGYCFGKASVEAAIQAIANGELVVVVDDYNRENEGDFIVSAELLTPENLAKLIRYSSGVVCVAMEDDKADMLDLPCMVTNNQDPKNTAFTVTVDAAKHHGITTGISALERCKTIQLLASPTSSKTDFSRPGHIFPLRAKRGGVLERDGHTEATVDLMKLAGLQPVGVLCEIVSEDNPISMARLPELTRFCKRHGFILTSIADIIQYRKDYDV